jgi:hypothetical protein
MALPDTAKFRQYEYKVRFSPDYVARPSIGYARDNFGRGVFGGTTIILSDLLGNNRLAFSGEVNGRISEARVFAAYTSLGSRLQYMTGIYQFPYYFPQGWGVSDPDPNGYQRERISYVRYIQRQAFATGIYPLDRFTRGEFGLKLTNLDRSQMVVSRFYRFGTPVSGYAVDDIFHSRGINYAQPYAAYVSDNVLWGYTGPLMGRRYRFQIEPTIGTFRWMEYLADYRRYDPVIFSFITVATRAMASISAGRDEDTLQKYIGYPELLRGYDRDREFFSTSGCPLANSQAYKCSPLFGSRVALANVEVRFPLLNRADIGILPISLPPIEGLVFYDVGATWFGGQRLHFSRPPDTWESSVDAATDRYLMTSYGFGVRVNLFNWALLRWDYARPLDSRNRDGYWRFSLGPSF